LEPRKIFDIKTKMQLDFNYDILKIFYELYSNRLNKIIELKEERKSKIDNWSAHYAGDLFFDEVEILVNNNKFKSERKKFAGYKYVEIQSENFRIYPKISNLLYEIKDTPLIKSYTIEDEDDLLFSDVNENSLNQKIPLFIVGKKNNSNELISLELIAKVGENWDKRLSINILEKLNLANEGSEEEFNEHKYEELPSVSNIIQLNEFIKSKGNEE
jgi:hypothetical protein